MSEEADTTATNKPYSARYSSQVALCFFSTEQSNADKRRLDRERCLSHPVASLGESWTRDPVALSWRVRSLSVGVSVRDPALMKYYDRALKRLREGGREGVSQKEGEREAARERVREGGSE